MYYQLKPSQLQFLQIPIRKASQWIYTIIRCHIYQHSTFPINRRIRHRIITTTRRHEQGENEEKK